MTMKKTISIFLALLLLLSMVAGCTSTQSGSTSSAAPTASASAAPTSTSTDPLAGLDPVTIKFAHAGDLGASATVYTEKWIDAVEKASNGKISFDYYPAGQLGSLAELAEAIDLGTLDMAKLEMSTMSSYFPEAGITSMPFLIQNYSHAGKVFDGEVGDQLKDMFRKNCNAEVMGYFWIGFRNIVTKTPATSVAELKNILIRSPEAQVYLDTFNTLGMKPTPIAFNEMYNAMSTGIVDAVETTPELIYNMGFYKLGKYVLKSNHIFTAEFIGANTDFWNKLPDAYKEIMVSCMNDVVKEERAYVESSSDSFYDKIQTAGGVISEWKNYQDVADLFTPYWSDKAKAMSPEAVKMVETITGLTK